MSDAHIAWYRTDVRKSPSKTVHVMVCVAWKPAPDAHKVTLHERGSWGPTEKFADANEEYVARVYEVADRIIERAKADAATLGLKLRFPGTHKDPEFLKYLSRPVQCIDYLNFMWVEADVPYSKGQKALAKKLAAKFAEYSSEFAKIGMTVQSDFSDDLK